MLRAHKVDFNDCFEVSELRDRLKATILTLDSWLLAPSRNDFFVVDDLDPRYGKFLNQSGAPRERQDRRSQESNDGFG